MSSQCLVLVSVENGDASFFLTLPQAFISSRRLSRFLCCSEKKYEVEQEIKFQPTFPNDQSDLLLNDMAVVMHDACCAWSSSDEDQNLVLNHVTLSLPKGHLVAVVGEVKYLLKGYFRVVLFFDSVHNGLWRIQHFLRPNYN